MFVVAVSGSGGGVTKVTTLHSAKSAHNTSFNYGCIDNVCVCACEREGEREAEKYAIGVRDILS